MTVDEAFERIKSYCDKVIRCEDCRYCGNDGRCVLVATIPMDWERPEKEKKGDEK